MSKKKIFAIIASLVIIFGLGFAGYSAMHKSSGTTNSYTASQKQDKTQTSSSSSSAPKAEKAASNSSSATATSGTSDKSTTDTSSGKVSGLKNSGNSTTGTKSNATANKSANSTTAKKSAVKSVSPTTSHRSTTSHAATTHAAVCSLTVRGPIKEGNKVLLHQSNIRIHKGDKVSTILKRVGAAKHVAVSYQGAGASVYIRGIAGLFEFDKGSGSGWLYSVNNKFPGYSAGKYTVKSGDKIQWLYTTNLGKDRDAPQVTQK